MINTTGRILLLVVVVGGYAADWNLPVGGEKAIMGPDPLKPIEERQVLIRAKPHWEKENDLKWLVLPVSANETVKIYCPSKLAERTLPEEELTFTIWWTKEVIWHTDDGQEESQWYSTLDSVKGSKKTYYDAAKCSVHGTTMQRADLEIHYGLLAMNGRDSKKFSGGPGWVSGGCVIMAGAASKQRGYRCERCMAAYQEWVVQVRKKSERLRLKEQAASGS